MNGLCFWSLLLSFELGFRKTVGGRVLLAPYQQLSAYRWRVSSSSEVEASIAQVLQPQMERSDSLVVELIPLTSIPPTCFAILSYFLTSLLVVQVLILALQMLENRQFSKEESLKICFRYSFTQIYCPQEEHSIFAKDYYQVLRWTGTSRSASPVAALYPQDANI